MYIKSFRINEFAIYMKKYKYIIKCLIFAFYPAVYTPANINIELNHDSTITFTYKDSLAHRVIIKGDGMLFHKKSVNGHQRMYNKSKGVWEYTTTMPIAPNLYTYQLFVDGVLIDSVDSNYLYLRNKKKNFFLIENNQSMLYKCGANERGTIKHIEFLDCDSNAFIGNIYLPYQYQDTMRYPVLFLFHGINGNHFDWIEQGRIANILDNLIQNRKIQPIIVVTPRCFLTKSKNNYVRSCIFNYNKILTRQFEKHFFKWENYIDAHYSITHENNAIAGLSCGARQAANIRNTNTNRYKYMGLLSPVLTKQQLPMRSIDTLKLWIGVGADDWVAYGNTQRYIENLNKMNIGYTYLETEGGHCFMNWRKYITYFLLWAFPIINNKEVAK